MSVNTNLGGNLDEITVTEFKVFILVIIALFLNNGFDL